ncbi:MAG: M48 family metalloprotease [Candidatus Muiribacteriota bacterium]
MKNRRSDPKCTGCGSENFREVLTSNGVLIDYCDDCGGIWLEKGEIYFFTKSPSYLKYHIDKASKQPADTERKNPKTGNKLLELSLFDGKLIIDYDPDTEGIFLDKGELEALPGHKEMGIEIHIDKGFVSKKNDVSTKKEKKNIYKRVSAGAGGLMSVPNLGLISSITLIGLYTILGLVILTLSFFGILNIHQGFLIYLIIIFIQFIFSPFIMDFIQTFLYRVNWLTYDELPDSLKRFMNNICTKNNIKCPSFGLIPDGSPNAFTYGHHPNNARIVLTEGMFTLLDEDELNGVVAHEVGHAVNWDMLLMTIMQIVPMLLYYIYSVLSPYRNTRRGVRSFSRRSSGSSKGKLQQQIVAMGAYVLYIVSQYIVLYFSRVREYYADRFAGKYVSPSKLASALVKIGYGMAGKNTGSKNKRDESLNSVKSLGIFDENSAKGFVVMGFGSENTGVEKMGGEVNKDGLKKAMRWDMWNPWAKYFEIHSTHPLIAKRLLALSKQAQFQGENAYIDFDEKQPESYWNDFFMDVFYYFTPNLLFGISLVLLGSSMWGLNTSILFKLCFLLFGVSLIFSNKFRYNSDFFPTMKVSSLLKKVKVSPIRGVPVNIKGKIIGRGKPGLIWDPNFILQDDTGIVFLDYSQPLAILNFLFGLLKAGGYKGQNVQIEGWYRRAPIPYIEIKNISSPTGLHTCYTYHIRIYLGYFITLLGILIFLMPGI